MNYLFVLLTLTSTTVHICFHLNELSLYKEIIKNFYSPIDLFFFLYNLIIILVDLILEKSVNLLLQKKKETIEAVNSLIFKESLVCIYVYKLHLTKMLTVVIKTHKSWDALMISLLNNTCKFIAIRLAKSLFSLEIL